MWCPQCGATLRDSAPVCENCGAEIPVAATGGEPFASSTPSAPAGSEPPMRAGRFGPLSPPHAPDSTTSLGSLGSLDAAAEAEWDAAWPPVQPLESVDALNAAGGRAAQPPVAPLSPDLTMPGRMAPPAAARPPASPFSAQHLQTPRLQAPRPGEPRSPFWPDERSGRDNQAPLDANLPAWLFDRPEDWKSPDAAGDLNASVPAQWDAPPAAGGGFSAAPPMPSPSAPAWDQPPRFGSPTPAPNRTLSAGIPTPRGIHAPEPPAAAPAWGQTPGAPPPPPWQSLREQLPAGMLNGDAAWPDEPPLPVMPAKPRGRLGGMRWSRRQAGQGGTLAGKSKGRKPSLTEDLAQGRAIARDTGRGWRIVAPVVDPSSATNLGWIAPAQPRPSQALALIGGLSRLTFNVLLLSIILAILAIPVGIGLMRLRGTPQGQTIVHPTATAAPIPTPFAGFKNFAGQAAGFTIAYPVGWSARALGATVAGAGDMEGEAFSTGAKGANVTFAVLTRPAISSPNLIGVLNNGYIPIVPGQIANYNPLSAPDSGPVVAGEAWQQATYTFDLAGVPMEATALVANHGALTYLIVFQAPQSQFSGLRSAE
ncbi:MAG TPA: zinc ribbon domain-containing protein, partial [Ktedonobacterales bacterium]